MAGSIRPPAYDEARDLLVDRAVEGAAIEDDRKIHECLDLAHGMEQIGRRFCRAAATDCEECPLECLLPEGGPRGAED